MNLSFCGQTEFANSELSILSFNRLNTTSINSVSKVVETLTPSIIGLQESYELGLQIADRFNYCFLW